MNNNESIPGVARVFENGRQVGRVVTDPQLFQDYYEKNYDMDLVRREWSLKYRTQKHCESQPNLKSLKFFIGDTDHK